MDDQFTEWHSVRPWHPSLSLYVREITSVSVTFILTSPYSSSDSTNADLASLGLSSSDDDDQSRDSASTADTAQNQVLPDLLAKGLSVKVNGTPWQRVILKMDDVLDEAIIILYGLMPARQYDIELGILPGEASVRSQITTDNDGRADTSLPEPLPEESVAGSPNSSSIPLSSSPSHTNGGAHSPNGHTSASPFTLEDRRLQLTHALSLLNTEHSNLTTSLKSARRESQKADAQLRSEIDILKRASDRHAAGESRARKKVLALQEAVKQTLAAARDIEELIKDVEAALPALEVRRSEVEKEWAQVKEEAARVRAKREEAEQREKVRAEAMQAELAGLVNRLEKLSGKREKLEGEGGVLAELEERLRKLEEERERVENDPFGYEADAAAELEEGDSGNRERAGDSSSPEGDSLPHAGSHRTQTRAHPHNVHTHGAHPQAHLNPTFPPHANQHAAHPRKRHSHPHAPHTHPHHHPRQSFPPPHRPGVIAPAAAVRGGPFHASAQSSTSTLPPPTSSGAGSGAVPGVLHIPVRQPPHKNHAHAVHARAFRAQPSSGSSSTSTASGTATPAGNPNNANHANNLNNGASLLSGRAPPFEPSRSRAHSHSHSHSSHSQIHSQQQTVQAAVAAKSELNPGSTPFSPRANVAQAAASAVGTPARMAAS